VCLSVRTLKGKWLELSAAKLIDVHCMTGTQHTLTLRSKWQVAGTTVKLSSAKYTTYSQWQAGRPDVGVHVDMTAYVF